MLARRANHSFGNGEPDKATDWKICSYPAFFVSLEEKKAGGNIG